MTLLSSESENKASDNSSGGTPAAGTPDSKVPAAPAATQTATPKSAVHPAPSKSASDQDGRAFAIIALVAALLAIAAVVYLWLGEQQQSAVVAGNSARIAGDDQLMDRYNQQIRELLRQLDRQTDESERQAAELKTTIESLQNKIASQQKRLLSLSTTDRDDWLLAEAEYLMQLANQRLLMGKEIEGARQLLAAADAIMVELDDSGLYPVRKALAEDMAKLNAAGKFDLEGLYLRLGALADQADQLQLFAVPALTLPPAESTVSEDWQQQLQSGLAAAWKKLRHYIQIKRRDEIYQPILAPEYEAALRQNLRLMFEQAQWAALQGKQKLYNDSLKKARYWLDNYYTLDEDASRALSNTVKELEAQRVEVYLPDISGSRRALKNYLEMLHGVAAKPLLNPAPAVKSETESNTESSAGTDTANADSNTKKAAPESAL